MATQPPLQPPEPLSVNEVKLNLRIVNGAEDLLIGALIATAREYVEDHTGLILTPRIVTETATTLGRWIDLASWPVINVTEIRYPKEGSLVTLPASSWHTSYSRRPVRVLPTAFGWGVSGWGGARTPSLPIEIEIEAGFSSPASVPATVKQAMHLLIAHLYAHREAVEVGATAAAVEIPFGVETLLRKHRLARV